MRLVMLGLVLAVGQASTAFAQAASDNFDLCAREQDPAVRLACFDRQIAARRAANSGSAAVPKSPPKAAAISDVGLDSRQLRKLHPERAESENASMSIEGKVIKVIARRPLISAFELDNGQTWEQSETAVGLWIRPQETVTIREGTLGSFMLKSADGHVVRVHRVK